ncbi:MAG: GntR family transcriptional regulator [Gemmatimonadota bacterium]
MRTVDATVSKSQLAYTWVRERIADGRFSPGYRLVLGQIAGELGVSAVPVREAIRLLEAEGLITFERNVGAQVAMLNASEYQVTMQTLSLLEGYATALAAPTISVVTLRRAREVNAAMRANLVNFEPVGFTRLNADFHTLLFGTCPNPHVLDLVHRGWTRLNALRSSTFSFVPGRAPESVEEHDALLDLIEGGADPLDIELCARNHRLSTLDAFLAHNSQQ